ncbi:unnamed protein product [Acanthoscelides obtectus]|uniref:Uncharacterized protein n=1 Tax=Acanthoscelides obtectus TaxID=200917 RepID=A0A9P0K176_ACAOB|nr:unnamed protein product [Acanthoscelides obtectus]CAK1627468.1 hypothetical protein AOBTE_LOCUS4619 [Acanthoscelides obtectus]
MANLKKFVVNTTEFLKKLDIVAVSETWLSKCTSSKTVNIPGFSFCRNDRPSRGGGVGIYISSNINHMALYKLSKILLELLRQVALSWIPYFCLMLRFAVKRVPSTLIPLVTIKWFSVTYFVVSIKSISYVLADAMMSLNWVPKTPPHGQMTVCLAYTLLFRVR